MAILPDFSSKFAQIRGDSLPIPDFESICEELQEEIVFLSS